MINPSFLPTAGCSDSLIKELHHFRILGEEQVSLHPEGCASKCCKRWVLMRWSGWSPGSHRASPDPETGKSVRLEMCVRTLGFSSIRQPRQVINWHICHLPELLISNHERQQHKVTDEQTNACGGERRLWDPGSLTLQPWCAGGFLVL